MARTYGGNRRSHASVTMNTGTTVIEEKVTPVYLVDEVDLSKEITIQGSKSNLLNDSVEVHSVSAVAEPVVVEAVKVEPVATPTKKGKK